MWTFVFIFWVVLVAGIFWAYAQRQKKSNTLRAREIDALISTAKKSALQPAAVVPPVAAEAPEKKALAPVSPGVSKKARLLEQRDALLYLLLRTGLPDHEVFHDLTLAEVLEPAEGVRGYEREQSVRRLAQTRLDFVVCNKRLEIVAVVMFDANGLSQNADRNLGSTLESAGVRLVNIDPLAMPRHQQIRGLLYADAAPPAG
jgi:alpha-D-ribose 1-methylphosphonate 5-triphosphate synthase subunit PhnG